MLPVFTFVKNHGEREPDHNVDFFIPYNKQFGNVDMNWDVLINMKINKYLNATLNTTLKYDNDSKNH